MHPTKSPGCIYVEKTPEQYCLGRYNSQGAWEGVCWDKHSSDGLNDQQMKGQDHLKRVIQCKRPSRKGGGGGRKSVEKTTTVIKSKRNIFKNYSHRTLLRKNLCAPHLSIHCFSLLSYPLQPIKVVVYFVEA